MVMPIRTPPGEILKEAFMAPLGLSGSALGRELKVPANRINDIQRGPPRDLRGHRSQAGALFRRHAAVLAQRPGRL